jgi:hypothetical protein
VTQSFWRYLAIKHSILCCFFLLLEGLEEKQAFDWTERLGTWKKFLRLQKNRLNSFVHFEQKRTTLLLLQPTTQAPCLTARKPVASPISHSDWIACMQAYGQKVYIQVTERVNSLRQVIDDKNRANKQR